MTVDAATTDHGDVGAGRRAMPTIVWQVGLGAGLLVTWEFAVATGLLAPGLISRPSAVATALWRLLLGEEYFRTTVYNHVWVTFKAMGLGYVLGSVSGIAVGFWLARSRRLTTIIEPYILAIAALPKISLAPLFVLIFGIDLTSKVAIVTLMVFVMLFFNTFSGVRQVNTDYIQLARIMGADRFAVARKVILPAAKPAILVGLRMAVPFAMVGAIIGEFIASTAGIGWAILQSSAFFDVTRMIAGVIVLLVTTWLLGQLVGLVERRALRWQR